MPLCGNAKPPAFSGRNNWWSGVGEGVHNGRRVGPELRPRHDDLSAAQWRTCPRVQDHTPCGWTGDVVLKLQTTGAYKSEYHRSKNMKRGFHGALDAA